MRLTKQQATQVRCDLTRSPHEFGYSQPTWTATCLSRHLHSKYKVLYAVRHCRRLILSAKSSANSECVEGQLDKKAVPETKLRLWSGFSDEYRHKKILHRLRQLSSSGLPLKQFSESLFEQLTAATNCGEAMQIIGLDDPKDLKLIFRDRETLEWTASHLQELQLVNSDDPGLSGMNVAYSQLRFIEDPVLPTERFMTPRFQESPAYHEVWRHHRVYSGVMNFFRDNNRYVGLAPIWKSRTERPFSSDDLTFLRLAVPFITHGLVAAQATSSQPTTVAETEQSGPQIGVVTADLRGRILAMDRTARILFSQPAILDGRPTDAFATSNLREGLRYVSAVVQQAFGAFDFASEPHMAVPAARVWWHATGTVLLLKAVLGERVSGLPFVTILVEERQLVSMKHKRLALRHGMSPRESEVFRLVGAGTPRKEIAYQLGLSVNTVRTYIKEIGLKGLPVGDLHSSDA